MCAVTQSAKVRACVVQDEVQQQRHHCTRDLPPYRLRTLHGIPKAMSIMILHHRPVRGTPPLCLDMCRRAQRSMTRSSASYSS